MTADRAIPACPGLRDHVPLAPLTTMGLGGAARYFADVTSAEELKSVLAWANANSVRVFILGGGSNVVCSDEGYPGLVIRIGMKGLSVSDESDGDALLTVAAGESWDTVVEFAVSRDLQGIECLSGIPGFAGATPIQNVGAYGQEVKDVLDSVTAIDRQTGTDVTFGNADCRFGYRMSRFKAEDRDRYAVTSVALRLRRGGKPHVRYGDLTKWFDTHGQHSPSLQDVRLAVLQIRAQKAMVIDPDEPNSRSCGSFFMNPIISEEQYRELCSRLASGGVLTEGQEPPSYPAQEGFRKLPAAWLIERAGIRKGYRTGNAGISEKHVLAIVNCGGATAAEVRALAEEVQDRVQVAFGVTLEPEPVYVGFGGAPAAT